MNLTKDTILYDILDDKIVVLNVRDDGHFDALHYSTVKIHYDGDKNIEVKENKEECTLKISNIGCTLFYSQADKNKGKELSTLREYEWNKNNIVNYYNSKEQEELARILKNAPSSVILNESDRKNLIKGYLDIKFSKDEEQKFSEKYKGKYFARMDFDIEFFKRNKEFLWKNHYYDKVYVGKQGTVYDDKNNVIIADWRSPIGGFVNDNKNRAYNIGENLDPLYSYNYELLLKRRFSFSDGDSKEVDFKNVWVADSGFYNDGDMDTFLLDVLTRLRREGNDKAVDIIETIQKEQNDIVRLDNRSFYVQGCAGSGKTMVLLHRLSYLSYNDKKFDFSKVKIITPNENIIVQLRDLSAQLEISNIEQLTIEQYYIETIKEYSESLYNTLTNKYSAAFGRESKKYTLKSENALNEEFLQYIYSDEFKQLVDNRYKAYFESLFLPVSEFIKTPNNYDLKSLQNLTHDMYLYLDKYEKNKIEIENLNNDAVILNNKIKEHEKNINIYRKKHEIALAKSSEIKKYQDIIQAIDEILSIEEDIKQLNSEKEGIDKSLNKITKIDIDVDPTQKYKNEEIKNLEELEETLSAYKKSLKDLNALVDKNKKIIEDLNNENTLKEAQYQSLLNEYQAINKINIFKRQKIKNEYQNVRKLIEQNTQNIDKFNYELDDLSKKINQTTKKFDNFLINAYFYMKALKQKLNKQQAQINNKISSLVEQESNIRNKFNLTTNYISEKEKNTKLANDIQKEIEIQQKELKRLEHELEKDKNQKAKLESKLKALGCLSGSENRTFKQICNKLLLKENDKFTSKLKLTGNSIIEEILMPELNNLYLKYDIVDNKDIYKHILYLILYLLIKLRGEKSLSNLICIDEAQDITLNEYRIIKSLNKNAIFNLFGDTNQLLYKGRGIETWASLSSAGYELQGFKLNRNYRNVANITKYCNRNLIGLEMIEMGVEGDSVKEIELNSLKDYLNEINIVIIKNKETLKLVDNIFLDYNFIENKNQLVDKSKLNVITVEMSKGMEFSKVIVIDKDMIRREKYIAYTRALNKLVVCKIK